MKKVLFTTFLLFVFSLALLAQQNLTLSCGLGNIIMNARMNNVNYDRQMAEEEKLRFDRKTKNLEKIHSVVTIPVVVHVVWNTSQENVSDAQIISQINVLNQDFRKLNSDTANTPAPFKSIATDPQIEFCLASVDPNGNPTNGITRTQTNKTVFNIIFGDSSLWHTSLGGFDGWDPDKYLNMWVCDLGFVGGIGFWPGGTSIIPGSRDGVAINYIAFGTMGSATAPYNLGRTATHEVGHYLDLHHLWGDVQTNSNCQATDYCNDTPTQFQATQGNCPSFPKTDACTPSGNGIMWMNYMDYTNDNCRNMFTADQSIRMQACLAGPRASLLSSNVCTPTISTDDVSFNYDVSVFPNPTMGIFNIQSTAFNIQQIEVINMLGEIIIQKTTRSKYESIHIKQSGVYFVRIHSEDNSTVKKIIIQ